MSDFKQAIQWLKEGKKVRRKNWIRKLYSKHSKSVWDGDKMKEGIFFFDDDAENTKKYEFIFDDFEATDWEIFEEPKESLSEKVKTNWSDVDKGMGYFIFEKDVKEKIQNAQRRLKEPIEEKYYEETIDKIFKEEFGDKLI